MRRGHFSNIFFEMSDARRTVGSGAHQRAQTAAATGSVSRLATRTGLAAWSGGSRSTGGPPRVLGSQELSDKRRYAQRWNQALLAEAIDAANATKQRIGALTPAALARFVYPSSLSMLFRCAHLSFFFKTTGTVWHCLDLLPSLWAGCSRTLRTS